MTVSDSLLSKDSSVKDHLRPSTWRLYFELTRLHKFPIGTLLVFWPCAWGLSMAAYTVSLPPKQLAIQTAAFFVWSTVAHSAACVLSDMCDRDFDRQVERTKNRPLAAGHVSMFGATVFILPQVAVSLLFLAFVNRLAFYVGLFGLVPLHAFYPLMKRWTNWPQAWLGLTFSWGGILAWVSVTASIEWRVVTAIVLSVTFWSIVYDTIYACQDKRDDVKAGVKSTAVLFGSHLKPILSVFAFGVIVCLTYAGYVNHQGPAFFTAVGCSALHFTWQLLTLEENDQVDCSHKFKSNHDLGYIIWIGLLIDYYFKVLA